MYQDAMQEERTEDFMVKRDIQTKGAPSAIGPYSQAIAYQDMLFISGQIGLCVNSGEIVAGGIEEESRQLMENLKAILQAGDLDFSDVVKTTIYLSDINDFPQVNKIYEEYIQKPYPARSTIAVQALPKGALLEIDMIAAKPKREED